MRPKLSPGLGAARPPPAGSRTCRRRPMTADANPWTLNLVSAGPLVGSHQNLLGGYEAGSLVIANGERTADCRHSLIRAEYELRLARSNAPLSACMSAGSGWPWAAAPAPWPASAAGWPEVGPPGRPWPPSRCRVRRPQTIVRRAGRSRPARTRARSSSSPCRPPFGSRGPGCGWRRDHRRRRSARW